MEKFANLEEVKENSTLVYDGDVVHLYKDTAVLPNGKTATREVIRHIGAVGIVPMTEDGKVIVERQFRYPINQVVTEIPAGKLDSKTENPLLAAKRELEEETGLRAENWKEIGCYIPVAAYSDEVIHLYLATGLSMGQRNLDEDEFLNIEERSLDDLVNEIMEGKIPDGKTQVAILKVNQMLKNK